MNAFETNTKVVLADVMKGEKEFLYIKFLDYYLEFLVLLILLF
jgi:hypothetical protein